MAQHRAPIRPAAVTSFGTKRYDPETGARLPGEYNEAGLPMGQRPAPGPSALSSFRAGGGTPGLDSLNRLNTPAAVPAPRPAAPVARPVFAQGATAPARDYGVADQTARLSPTTAFATQPLTMGATPAPTAPVAAPAPSLAAPATPAPVTRPAPVARAPWGGLPTNPDDRALLTATRGRDAAARAPEPIVIPGGDPEAAAWNAARGTGHPNTIGNDGRPIQGPVRASVNPVDPATLAVAGTGKTLRTPWGTASSTTAGQLARNAAPVPAAATAAPPQGVPRSQPAAPALTPPPPAVSADTGARVAPASAFPSPTPDSMNAGFSDSPSQRSAWLGGRTAPATSPMATSFGQSTLLDRQSGELSDLQSKQNQSNAATMDKLRAIDDSTPSAKLPAPATPPSAPSLDDPLASTGSAFGRPRKKATPLMDLPAQMYA